MSVATVPSFAGLLVIEEDDHGDAMFVVLCGQCEVRARPVQTAVRAPEPARKLSIAGKSHSSGSNASDSDSDDEQGNSQPASSVPAATRRSVAEHTATYWIHKYMEQVSIIIVWHCFAACVEHSTSEMQSMLRCLAMQHACATGSLPCCAAVLH